MLQRAGAARVGQHLGQQHERDGYGHGQELQSNQPIG